MSIIDKINEGTFWKFILVGILNTVVGTIIMFVLYNVVHLSYWVSTASNYIVGSLLSYFFNKYFTFKDTNSSFENITKFILNITLCYFIAYGLTKPFIIYIFSNSSKYVQENISMFVGIFVFTITNYMGQKFFVFKKSN